MRELFRRLFCRDKLRNQRSDELSAREEPPAHKELPAQGPLMDSAQIRAHVVGVSARVVDAALLVGETEPTGVRLIMDDCTEDRWRAAYGGADHLLRWPHWHGGVALAPALQVDEYMRLMQIVRVLDGRKVVVKCKETIVGHRADIGRQIVAGVGQIIAEGEGVVRRIGEEMVGSAASVGASLGEQLEILELSDDGAFVSTVVLGHPDLFVLTSFCGDIRALRRASIPRGGFGPWHAGLVFHNPFLIPPTSDREAVVQRLGHYRSIVTIVLVGRGTGAMLQPYFLVAPAPGRPHFKAIIDPELYG